LEEILRSSIRWLAMLVAVAWMAPAAAPADDLVDISVLGATEEARAFATVYKNQAQTSEWTVIGSLVRIYRVHDRVGTVTINAVLAANTPPRIAQGPTSQQSLRLHTAWSDTTLRSAGPVPPNQSAEVSYDISYDTTGVGEQVVVFSTQSYAALCGLPTVDREPPVACATIEGFLVFLLRDAPEIHLGYPVRPPLLQGNPRFFQFTFPVLGMSPLTDTDLMSVLIDGVPMKRVASTLSQSPGNAEWFPIYPGPDPLDPITPIEVVYPGDEPTNPDRFLFCGGGGCGPPDVRLGLPADLGTGLHSIAVKGSRWRDGAYTFHRHLSTTAPWPSEPAGSAELDAEEEFITVDPKISVSPSQAEPGSTITVTGTGFAPANQIPVRFKIHCCGEPQLLGTVITDATGAFTLQATLPTAPFANVWSPSAPPGTTTGGAVRAFLGDAAFLQRYSLGPVEYSGEITFVKPGATSTTTTTIPGGGAIAPGGLDVPACTQTPVPPKADKKFEKAASAVDDFEQLILEHAAKKKLKRVIGKAQGLLRGVRRLMNRAKNKGLVSEGCANAAFVVIDDLAAEAQSLRDDLQ